MKKDEKKTRKTRFSIFGILIIAILSILGLSGCASSTVGSSESVANVLNMYAKKPLSDGYYWNFGIGKNYTEAMEDALKSMPFMRPVEVKTEVMTTSMKSYDYKGGDKTWSSHDPDKIMHIKPYNVYNSNARCKVQENWDIPGGILIVRKCPDLQWFSDNGFDFKDIK